MSNFEAPSAEALLISERRYQELRLGQKSYPDVKVFPAQFAPRGKPGLVFSTLNDATFYDIYFGYGAPPNDIGRPGDVYVDGVKDPVGGPDGILWAREPHISTTDRAKLASKGDCRLWTPYNPFDRDTIATRHFLLLRHPASKSARYLISDRINGLPIWITEGAVANTLKVEEFRPKDPISSSKVFLCSHPSYFPAQSTVNISRTANEVRRRQEVLDCRARNNAGSQAGKVQSQHKHNKKRRLSGTTIVISPQPERAASSGLEQQTTLPAPPTMRRPVSGVGQSGTDQTASHVLPPLSGGGGETRTKVPPDSSRADEDQLTYPGHSGGGWNPSVERQSRMPGASSDAEDAPDIEKMTSSFTSQLKDFYDLKVNKLKRKLEVVEQESNLLSSIVGQHEAEILQVRQEKNQLSRELADTKSQVLQHGTEILQLKSDKKLLQEKVDEAQKQLEADRAALRRTLLDLANNMP